MRWKKYYRKFLKIGSSGVLVWGVEYVIQGYQRYISPFLPKTCRYYPTCSEYSRQSFKKYGFLKGFVRSLGRIMRCHPWSRRDVIDLP